MQYVYAKGALPCLLCSPETATGTQGVGYKWGGVSGPDLGKSARLENTYS